MCTEKVKRECASNPILLYWREKIAQLGFSAENRESSKKKRPILAELYAHRWPDIRQPGSTGRKGVARTSLQRAGWQRPRIDSNAEL